MTQVFRLPFLDRAAHPLAGATVLQLIPDLGANAAAREAIEIAMALHAAGARALIACEGGRMTGDLQVKGGIFVPFPSRSKNPLAMAANVGRLGQLIAAERADIVHVRSRALAWVAYGAARRTKTPLVTTFPAGGTSSNPIAMRYNSVLARGDAVLAGSRFAASLARKLYAPAAEKIQIVHQGIDCRLFAPELVTPERVQEARRRWKVAPDERVVLSAANTIPPGGHHALIEAARLLKASGMEGVKFIIAGEHEKSVPQRTLDRAIAAAGLQGIMVRTGPCDWPAAYLAAAMVVLPASDAPSFGEAALQAQAMGTPVIAGHAKAAPEMILAPPRAPESARTGFLVKPGDAAALAVVIAHVLNLGASARGKLSARARKHVETKFSIEHMCSETLKVYAALR